MVARSPRAALRPFVERFLIGRFNRIHEDAHLPQPGPVAAFTIAGRVRVNEERWAPSMAFTGVNPRLRRHQHCDNHMVVLVMFKPAGATPFVDPPMNELAGALTDLQGIMPGVGDLRILHDELASSRTDSDRIATIEAFLLGRLRDDAFDPVVSAAIEWLERCGGTGRIAELAPYVGLSHSALERRFRRIVGTSPKTFASILRVRRALRLHDRGASLTAAAHGAGYFDQSHFTHEFQRMTGASPRVYLQMHRPQ